MKDSQCTEIAELVNKFSNGNGVHSSAIPGVNCIKFNTTIERFPGVYNPSLCIIVQGKKRVLLENEIFQYQPSEFLVASVDLPVIGQITEATKEKPYLCLQIELDLHELTELAMRVKNSKDYAKSIYPGIFIGDVDDSLADSVLRLVRLLDTQQDIEILSPIIKREIYYRLINGAYGIRIASITQIGSNMQRISAAIKILKTHFNSRLSMEEIATEVGMSISSFYTHFKSVTAMTPLQYQKRLRLLEARKIMINDRQDAASTAFQVGYESPSQFSREYARQFGNPPRRDVGSLSGEY